VAFRSPNGYKSRNYHNSINANKLVMSNQVKQAFWNNKFWSLYALFAVAASLFIGYAASQAISPPVGKVTAGIGLFYVANSTIPNWGKLIHKGWWLFGGGFFAGLYMLLILVAMIMNFELFKDPGHFSMLGFWQGADIAVASLGFGSYFLFQAFKAREASVVNAAVKKAEQKRLNELLKG